MCFQYIMRLPRYTRKPRKRCSTLMAYLVVTIICAKKTDNFFKITVKTIGCDKVSHYYQGGYYACLSSSEVQICNMLSVCSASTFPYSQLLIICGNGLSVILVIACARSALASRWSGGCSEYYDPHL